MSNETKHWVIIKELMNAKGWILQELIKRTNITRTTFFNIQHNKSKGSYETYLKIAKAFGVDVDVILGKMDIPDLSGVAVTENAVLPENLKFITIGDSSFINIPFVKKVTCCLPVDTCENIESFNYINSKEAGPNDFVMEIKDNELSPFLQKNDLVHVSRNEVVEDGDLVCIAYKDHSGAKVRYYRHVGDYYEFSKKDRQLCDKKKQHEFVLFGRIARIIRNL